MTEHSKQLAEAEITHVILEVTLPYCLYMPDGSMPVAVEGKPAYVTMHLEKTDRIRGIPDQIRVPHLSKMLFDRWGKQALTRLSLCFPRHSWPKGYSPNQSLEKQLLTHSLAYINKLIRIYKHVTNEYLYDELVEIDFVYYKFIYYNSRTKQLNQETCFFFSGNSLVTGEVMTLCDHNQYVRILQLLTEDFEIPTHQELAHAANAFLLKGQYSLATLLACQSFESSCKALIRTGYLKSGLKTEEQVEELLEKCAFANLLKDHIRLTYGYDFGNQRIFSRWEQEVRPVRNSIAHGGNSKISREKADQVIKILNEATEDIQENI